MTIICVGMAVVDILVQGFDGTPTPGTTAFVDRVGMGVGGDALNQASALAKLGHRCQLVTAVGDDAAGRLIKDSCADAGVDTATIVTDPELDTSTSVVLIDRAGERSFLSGRGGSADRLGARHVDEARLAQDVSVLSVGSLFTSPEFDRDVLPGLLDWAHARGAITVADLVTDHPEVTLDDLKDVLARLDFVVPSEAESLHYAGTADPAEAAAVFASYGVGTTVIKRGVRGAVAVRGDKQVSVSTFVVPVVDTTGSGDSFVAGFVSGLADGLRLGDCLNRAAATAAVSVQGLGATSAIAGLAQVNELIAIGRRRTT